MFRQACCFQKAADFSLATKFIVLPFGISLLSDTRDRRAVRPSGNEALQDTTRIEPGGGKLPSNTWRT
jgi:hypothetical protein